MTGSIPCPEIFASLEEGDILTLSGKNLSISYTGGDGNDVVLTALSDQTITFPAPADQTYGVGSINIAATATSGLPVSFGSNSLSICTVSGSTVSILDVGTCSITASQSGDANYNAALSVTQTFAVNKADQTISFSTLSDKNYGDADFSVSASATSGLAVSFASTTPSNCSVSGSTVSILAGGSCSISASQSGNSVYNAASNVVQTFTINKVAQTITFTALSDKSYGDADFAISATSDSGLAVGFASTTTSVCTVSGSTVSIVSAGTCSLTASQSGDTNYNAATDVTQSFTINKASQTISFSALSDKTYGDANFGLSASSDSGLAISFASNAPSVCSVSDSTVSIISSGSCTITASQSGDSNYSAAPDVVRSFNVNKLDQVITFNALADKSYGDANFAISASSDSGSAVDFASTTTAVCTVSGSTISIVSAGTCSITASQTGDSNHNAAADVVQNFSVNKAAQVISFASLSDKTYGDSDFAISASSDSGLSVSFASTTTSVCTVSGTSVSIISAGNCSITASQAGDSNYSAATDVIQSFIVNKATQTISFSALDEKTYGDADFGLSASTDSGLAVSFASTTTPVCTVTGSTVSIIAAGNCSITASQAGDTNYNQASDVVQSFTVNKADQAISFTALNERTYGDAAFSISASSNSGLAVTFTSTTTSVCTLVGTSVSIVSAGSCSITASQSGDSNYNAATNVVQSFTVNKADQTISFAALTDKTYGDAAFTISATSSSGLAVSFASSTSGVCTVTGSTVSILAAGSCLISASQVGNTNYNAATEVAQTFVVNKADQTISFSSLADKTFGDVSFAISASSDSGLSVSFSSTTMSVCTVSGSTVSIVGAGSCSITASQAGNTNYNTATDVVQSFTVNKASQSITFAAIPDREFSDGGFDLVASVDSGLAVTFASSTPSICTVSSNSISLVYLGECTITASQAGDGNYLAATDVVRSFNVAGDDTDGDGIPNDADNDDDNDGVLDNEDAFPLDSTESVDTDGDGIGNNADTDDDGDGYADDEDAFPLDETEWKDSDGDGIGDNSDDTPYPYSGDINFEFTDYVVAENGNQC